MIERGATAFVIYRTDVLNNVIDVFAGNKRQSFDGKPVANFKPFLA